MGGEGPQLICCSVQRHLVAVPCVTQEDFLADYRMDFGFCTATDTDVF